MLVSQLFGTSTQVAKQTCIGFPAATLSGSSSHDAPGGHGPPGEHGHTHTPRVSSAGARKHSAPAGQFPGTVQGVRPVNSVDTNSTQTWRPAVMGATTQLWASGSKQSSRVVQAARQPTSRAHTPLTSPSGIVTVGQSVSTTQDSEHCPRGASSSYARTHEPLRQSSSTSHSP